MPAMQPHLLARFQNTPMTSDGKNAEAAIENAAPTRNRILPGFCDVTQAANSATTSSRILEIKTRFCVEALGLTIL